MTLSDMPPDDGAQPRVALRSVSKSFPRTDRPAVRDVSLHLGAGELVALLGPSGCGKTTTLRLIAGFERSDTGSITINGQVVDAQHTWIPPERRGVGMVFQDLALFPHLSVADNVGFGLPRSFPGRRRARAERVAELLEMTNLADLGRRFPHELSGGQQQRVALARALAPAPHVLLLDEPFSSLDTDLRAQMRDDVRDVLRAVGASALLVTHDQAEAMTFADRVAIMLNGSIEHMDVPDATYHHPKTRAAAQFIGDGTFVPASLSADGLLHSDVGQFVLDAPQRQTGSGSIDLLLRPRDVQIDVDPNGLARIVARDFQGTSIRYRVALPCGIQLESSQPPFVRLEIGTAVRVRCVRSRVAAYTESDRLALATTIADEPSY